MDNVVEKEKVVLGLSGGVDSAVAAYLLKREGYEVIGAWLNMWGDEEVDNQGMLDAKAVAKMMGIEFVTRDVRDDFQEDVVSYFVTEYLSGRTPNPCVRCNRTIKFSSLLDVANELGAKYIATGHYSKIQYNATTKRYEVHSPADETKDQGYMLAMLTQEELGRLLTPLSAMESKAAVRALAEEVGIAIAQKKDSQEICFVDTTYLDFLEAIGVEGRKGFFVLDGEKKMPHRGIEKYTIGQRKGLGSFGKKVFVTKIDATTGDVFLGDNQDLFRTTLTASALHYVSLPEGAELGTCLAKIRYAAKAERCDVTILSEGRVKVLFEEPQRAITSGQIIVFYDDSRVLASAVID